MPDAGARTGSETGLQRIAASFALARSEERAALMPYMVGGFPDMEASRAVARAYAEGGADLVELGVPYSDPLADGPVIHAAATRALDAGATLDGVLDLCEEIATRVTVVLMVYANVLLTCGPERFAELAAGAGAAGVIVPDLPVEEALGPRGPLAERGLALIGLVAPTTTAERRARICAAAEGFVYVVSTTGVTGERAAVPAELAELVREVRAASDVPAAVGFGIGTPDQASEVGKVADGVIVGSRLVRIVADAESTDAAVAEVGEFLSAARSAMAVAGRDSVS